MLVSWYGGMPGHERLGVARVLCAATACRSTSLFAPPPGMPQPCSMAPTIRSLTTRPVDRSRPQYVGARATACSVR